MTPTLLFMATAAFAGTPHTGVPVFGIDGLGPPRFQTVDTGWMAAVPSGFVTIFVGHNPAEATHWIQIQLERLKQFKPKPNLDYANTTDVDEAFGDGVGLVLFRSGNIGVASRNRIDATVWADAVRQSIVDLDVPWPDPPRLIEGKDRWTIAASADIQHVAFVGGKPDNTAALSFYAPPYRLISWDGWGRAAWTDVDTP